MNILVTPQIQYNGRINDTLNWVELNGSFIATGGEKFLTIGNFHDGSLCDSLLTPNTFVPYCCYAYYYIDDVSLEEDSITGINEISKLDFSIYPNPAKNIVQLSAQEVMQEINVIDISNKRLLDIKPFKTKATIDLSQLDNGIYIFKCKFKNGEVLHKKIILQH